MTKEEAKATIDLEYPVTYQGIEYAKMTALIYRRLCGCSILQVELLDKNGHSITIADPARVTLA